MCACSDTSIRLVALTGGPPIHLGKGLLVIGRHPECDVLIDSMQVSRRHCCLTEIEGEVRVCDLGSTNGIRINGRRVESGRLRLGDELSIAHYRYRVEAASRTASLRVV
jgi:pSer/pThr/pTyr-binding forkhead associated (FHA) protein